MQTRLRQRCNLLRMLLSYTGAKAVRFLLIWLPLVYQSTYVHMYKGIEFQFHTSTKITPRLWLIFPQKSQAVGGIQSPAEAKQENHSSMPHKTLFLLISFSISQLDLAMTESNISLHHLVMVLMHKEGTSQKMDQCYFPSCYHVHYCFNYHHSDNGYPHPISSNRILHASVNQLQYACHSSKEESSHVMFMLFGISDGLLLCNYFLIRKHVVGDK